MSARPSDAQYRLLRMLPCDAGSAPRATEEALLRRGWADIEDTFLYSSADRMYLASSQLVLTSDGRAVREKERLRRQAPAAPGGGDDG